VDAVLRDGKWLVLLLKPTFQDLLEPGCQEMVFATLLMHEQPGLLARKPRLLLKMVVTYFLWRFQAKISQPNCDFKLEGIDIGQTTKLMQVGRKIIDIRMC
jgi:hypothetical protein